MFAISAGNIYISKNASGLISFANASFNENVITNANSFYFVFFFILIAFSLVSFFTYAKNKNVIEEDDYLIEKDEFEFYRPHRDF